MNFLFNLFDMIPGITKHKRLVTAILTAIIQGVLALQQALGETWISTEVLLQIQGIVGLYGGIGVAHAAVKKKKANGG